MDWHVGIGDKLKYGKEMYIIEVKMHFQRNVFSNYMED